MQLEATAPVDTSAIPVLSGWLGSWKISLARRPYAPDELTEHYDRQAKSWRGTVQNLGFDAAYEHLLGTVLRQERYAQQATRLRVLDAGIGTGAMSAALCRVVQRPVELNGIDISSAMLREATSTLKGHDVDLRLQQANLEMLPFEDDSFDIVLVAHVLEHLADPQKAIVEIHRVLKPGGLVVTCITRKSPAGAWIQWKWRTHRVAMRSALRWLRDGGFRSVEAMELDEGLAAQRLSVGYVGRKFADVPGVQSPQT